MADSVGTVVEVDVGAVGHGGFCVARHDDGRAVFVRHALPGERVRAVVTEDRGRHLRADAVEVLVASPDRVPEPCPYARPGRCGGCDWQHATLAAQRRLKAAVVAEQLQRLAGIDVPVTVEDVGPADGLGWRTRVGFAVGPDGIVGLRRHRSHDIEPVDRCLIAHPLVEDVGVERRRWPGTAAVEVVVSAATGDRALVVTPASRRAEVAAPPLDAKASLLRGDGRGGATALRGRPGVRETALNRTWRVSGSGFWQVHPVAAEKLATAVCDLLQPAPGEFALDLYAGVGLFAAALAPPLGPGGRVVAIEGDATSAADAAHNLADLPTVRIEAGRVATVLTRLGLRRCDLVVLDPPRAGAGAELSRRLAQLAPRAIAYVACDPAALARDVRAFGECGYRLAALRAFDLFPMTAHVECVALLAPSGG